MPNRYLTLRAEHAIALALLTFALGCGAVWLALQHGPHAPCPIAPATPPPRVVTRTVYRLLPAPTPILDVTIYHGSACITLNGHKVDPHVGVDCRLPGWPDPLTRGANGRWYDKD